MIVACSEKILLAVPDVVDEGDGRLVVVDYEFVPVIAFDITNEEVYPITLDGNCRIRKELRFYKYREQIHYRNAELGFVYDEKIINVFNEVLLDSKKTYDEVRFFKCQSK